MMAGVVSLTGVVISFAPALKKNQARSRYWIWMSASVKLLLPFALLAGIASHWVKPRAAAAPTNAGMYVAVEDVSEPFSATDEAAPVAQGKRVVVARAVDPIRDGETVTNGATAPVAATQVSDARPGAPGFVARVVPVLPLVGGAVWFAGFATVLVLWCVRWRRVARTMREAAPVGGGREIGLLRRTERAAGLKRPIELRASASSMEPGVFGIVRPVLAWPTGISHRLDDAHLEAILAHEVCHVRRRDNLTAALHMFVEAVFWFHPMVWWVGARLVEERERACDEEVLRLCRQPEVYAESILKVCEFCVQSPLECVSGVTGADLKKRVIEIMTKRVVRKLTLGKKLLLVAVGMVVVAVPIVLGQAQAARRMMAAALKSAPRPLQFAAHAMIAEEETLSTGEIAEIKVDEPAVSPVLAAAGPSASTQAGSGPNGASVPFPLGISAEEEAIAKTIVFDVASFRVNNTNQPSPTFEMKADSDGLVMLNRPMRGLIRFAYAVTSGVNFHFANEPAWIDDVKWDIRAKVAPEDLAAWQKLSPDAKKLVLRRFLADYLKLSFHTDTTPYTYYNLVVDKRGAKMAEARPGDNTSVPYLRDVPESSVRWLGPGAIAGHAGTMAMLAIVLSGHTPYVVHDETELTGKYNFAISYAPGAMDDPRARAQGMSIQASPEDDRPSIFTAVEQLGLKLVATKGPLEGIVIDHVERPPEN